MLTPCWTWTELANQSPSQWHIHTLPVEHADHDQETLTAIVEALLERAAAILAPPDPTS